MVQFIDTPPKVFVVGVTTPVADGIEEYLKYRGAGWALSPLDPHISRDPEAIVEAAGRVCYQSWNNPSSKRRWEYIQQSIVEHGHGCYDAATDVLTRYGWKAWPDVTAYDELATLTRDGSIEFHRPLALTSYNHRGSMYRVESRGVDLLVTPNHNMLVCPTTTKEGRKKEQYQLIRADALGHRSHAYLKSGRWEGGEELMSRDEAALLGFAIGDGSFMGKRALQFHLRRERKISWLRGVVARLGLEMREPGSDKYVVYMTDDLINWVEEMYDGNREKQIPPYLLANSSRSILEGLFEGLMQSDGHVGRTGDSFDTTSDHLADQIQHLALLIGLAANVCYRREDRDTSHGDKPLTRLSIIRRELQPEINKFDGAVGKSFWIEDWEGDVYCAEVPNNTLYVRRNGRPVWCGNSVLEHLWFNCLVADLPRSSQLELVRHGDGTAFSFESTRFTDKHLRFIIPPKIRRDSILVEAWKAGINDAVERYEHVIDSMPDDGETGTLKRKRAKEAARSLLPNAQGSDGMFSVNARAARHIINLRTDEHADLSIREFAYALYQALKPWAPAVFADAIESTDALGIPTVTFKVPKV